MILGIAIASCESEYDKQLDKAKQLVKQEMELEAANPEALEQTGYLSQSIEEINKTILFHAHLSGNRELFLKELQEYRSTIVPEEPTQNILITKYP